VTTTSDQVGSGGQASAGVAAPPEASGWPRSEAREVVGRQGSSHADRVFSVSVHGGAR
jgi:hypothetical protein